MSRTVLTIAFLGATLVAQTASATVPVHFENRVNGFRQVLPLRVPAEPDLTPRPHQDKSAPATTDRKGEACSGKESDEEVGVTYFGERWLIARVGRWASADPLHIHSLGGGEALNSYHYVSGNLLQARDPLGLEGGFGPEFREQMRDIVRQGEMRRQEIVRAYQAALDPEDSLRALIGTVGRFGVGSTVEALRCHGDCGATPYPSMGTRAQFLGSTGLRAELGDATKSQINHFMQAVAYGYEYGTGILRRPALAGSIGHEDALARGRLEELFSGWGQTGTAQRGIDYVVSATETGTFSMEQLDRTLGPTYEAFDLRSDEDRFQGRSRADVRATVMGWAFGAMAKNGHFETHAEAAEWLRTWVGEPGSSSPPGTSEAPPAPQRPDQADQER